MSVKCSSACVTVLSMSVVHVSEEQNTPCAQNRAAAQKLPSFQNARPPTPGELVSTGSKVPQPVVESDHLTVPLPRCSCAQTESIHLTPGCFVTRQVGLLRDSFSHAGGEATPLLYSRARGSSEAGVMRTNKAEDIDFPLWTKGRASACSLRGFAVRI